MIPIVPVVTTPGPIIVYGASAKLLIESGAPGIIVKETGAAATPFNEAVIFTGVGALTCPATTGNVAVFVPAGTITFSGTCADGESLASVTTIPPTNAGLLSVTVPVRVCPLDQV